MERRTKEEVLALARELDERRKNDPLLNFEPFRKQREFIDSTLEGKKRENYYIGANRSGKSDAGAFIGASLARFGYPESHPSSARFVGADSSTVSVKDRATSGWVSGIDFPTVRDTIQPKYFNNGFVPAGVTHEPFIPEREVEDWRAGDQILKLKNGSLIGFKSADSGRKKYQGAEKDWIHFDEEHPEDIYDECSIRVGARMLTMFTTCTILPPEGQAGGISWLFNRIVKPWQQGKLENVGVFNAAIYDNPHIPVTEIAILESKYPEGSITRRIRLDGELIGGLTGARVYAGFDYRLHVRRQPEIMLRRPLAWVWDFNVEPMVTLIGQREKDVFRVYRELILDEGSIPEMCDLFKSVHPYHLAEVWLYGDARGKDRSHQSKMSSYHVIMNEMKDYPAPLRMKVPETNPGVADRINAVNRALKNERGEICLEIEETCAELADDFEQVTTDGKGGIKKSYNRKDGYYRRTHTSDALGYWVAYEAPIRPIYKEQTSSRTRIRTPSYERGQVAARRSGGNSFVSHVWR